MMLLMTMFTAFAAAPAELSVPAEPELSSFQRATAFALFFRAKAPSRSRASQLFHTGTVDQLF